MNLRLLVCLLFAFLFGCKENSDIAKFDEITSYIYFAYPNAERNAVEKYTDSIFYSFALDENLTIKDKVLKIPVNIAGNPSNIDRTFELNVSPSSDYDPNLIEISEPILTKEKYSDTLTVKIKRGSELSNKTMTLILELSENENFKVGNIYNQKIKIAFSDVLVQPSWWRVWQSYFGTFHKEVFQKWMEIYAYGLDPTPELYNNIPPPYYYWNQMPTFVSATSFPITIMYIEKLKKYFQDNVVYPNGDTTQPRILLP